MALAPQLELANALEETAHVIEGVAQGLGALIHSDRVPKDLGSLLALLETTLAREVHALEGPHRTATVARLLEEV